MTILYVLLHEVFMKIYFNNKLIYVKYNRTHMFYYKFHVTHIEFYLIHM